MSFLHDASPLHTTVVLLGGLVDVIVPWQESRLRQLTSHVPDPQLMFFLQDALPLQAMVTSVALEPFRSPMHESSPMQLIAQGPTPQVMAPLQVPSLLQLTLSALAPPPSMVPKQASTAVQLTSQGRLIGQVMVLLQPEPPGHSNKHTPPVHSPPAAAQGAHSTEPGSHGPGAVVDVVVDVVDMVDPPVPPVDDVEPVELVEVEPVAPAPPPPDAPTPDVEAPTPEVDSDP